MLHGNGQVPCTTASRACGGGGGEDLLIPFSLLSKSYCSDFCCPVRHAVGALKFGLLVVHSRSLMPYFISTEPTWRGREQTQGLSSLPIAWRSAVPVGAVELKSAALVKTLSPRMLLPAAAVGSKTDCCLIL